MRPRNTTVNQVTRTTETQDTPTQEEIGMIADDGWIFTLWPDDSFARKQVIMAVRNERGEYIWLDSACFDHVCPKWFAEQSPIKAYTADRIVRAANGHRLDVHGTRAVNMLLGGYKRCDAEFYVMDVLRPLLSVPRLARQGYEVTFHNGRRNQQREQFCQL